jgi:hypothetical protein
MLKKINGLVVSDASYLGIPQYPKVMFRECYSLCIRIIHNPESDMWIGRANAFKNGRNKELYAGAKTLLHVLSQSPYIHVLPRATLVVGAIPSNSTTLNIRDPEFRLGHAIAEKFGFQWNADLLEKDVCPTSHAGNVSREERESHLKYRCTSRVARIESLIIVDDMCTSGATIMKICDAISKSIVSTNVIPAYAVTFAKNEEYNFNISRGRDISNNHISSDVNEYWNTCMAEWRE